MLASLGETVLPPALTPQRHLLS
ncbi:hypothetical protein SPHINGO391_420004 [Sphingomonas aurantiaca]|uniref:Uncharacterized protein n=1 Tax=Sphingomonas aurantiaca TaxID=185949 RepID=A0A5E7YZT6_9SPHN|nr:hypothetical protein SPHINGO391_420004 [Sphingomonas aurantiaca]